MSRILFIALLLMTVPLTAFAAAPVPGDTCGGGGSNANGYPNGITNSWTWTGVPADGGIMNGMFCNGSNWTGAITFLNSGNVGIGTVSPGAMLQVANRIIVGGSGSDTNSVFLTGGNSTSTGAGNTALGSGALASNTNGLNNVAIGYNALHGTTGGFSNAAFGENALYLNTTGSYNLAVGVGAGSANFTGNSDVLVGYNVGSSTLSSGSNNILIGTSSAVDTPASNTNNFLNIGNAIFATAMTGTLASPAGNVGIGTASPGYPLTVVGNAMNPTISLSAVGNTGYDMVDIAGSAYDYRLGVGNGGESNFGVPNKFFIFDAVTGTMRMVINTSGYVGMGTTAPQATLDVNGFARLKMNSSAPATCAAANEGSIALTHLAQVCVCDTANVWHVLNTATACSW